MKKIINNFKLLNPLIKFNSQDDFYFLQVLRRKKENPNQNKHVKLIRNFFIYNEEDYNNLQEKIIECCHTNNARAYIRLNKRSLKTCALQTLRKISELICYEQYKEVTKCYDSIAGKYSSDPDKKWVIDIDIKDKYYINNIINYINTLKPTDKENKLKLEIPTRSGYHLITSPFDVKEFKKEYPDLDMHKDNPTIAYMEYKE